MATYDLEEQEQIDQLKHFWAQYGNLITWVLIAVLGGFAAWNGWNWWQRSQSVKAAALYDEIERGTLSRDVAKTERALADIKDQFGGTSFAAQGALLAAQSLFEAGKADGAKAAVASNSGVNLDEEAAQLMQYQQGYQAAAKVLQAAQSVFETLLSIGR